MKPAGIDQNLSIDDSFLIRIGNGASFTLLYFTLESKGWLAIAKLKPHSLFISLLSMLKKAFYDVKIEK